MIQYESRGKRDYIALRAERVFENNYFQSLKTVGEKALSPIRKERGRGTKR